MPDSLSFFETLLHHTFQNPAYLLEAISHSSYANENKLPCNERLEFLGDAVLSIVVSEYLFNRRPAISEGDMSRIRAQSVCETALAAHARKMGIGPYLRLGKGEAASGGSDRASVLADAMEALIAALYLDGGRKAATAFVLSFLTETIEQAIDGGAARDYKTALQEKYQGKNASPLTYKVIRESGPDHAKEFTVSVFRDEVCLGTGSGRTKKAAEQAAAKKALEGTA
ncbi:MAG: ribonuclease III [Ruminococcaceae bacterium]|nr:ribonuclease III [Oscillospiraceae bacterium]